ncbi:uncharacterized protein C1orf115-like [Thalassophryne amazonica]|uniref:uncharacterized protein C1orf115-like n=1 Tax=Thalassophryne amazonica TaxID=390379 RepID=UPI001470FA79|nr:uncharacterized protein C1orf115-like [Thalassophryne amazonica]
MDEEDTAPSAARTKSKKSSRDVHFAILSEKYEPLIEQENEEATRRKEEKRRRRQERYKKYRKNVGRALRFTWRCLVAGLQNMASSYATPLSAIATVVMDVWPSASSKA